MPYHTIRRIFASSLRISFKSLSAKHHMLSSRLVSSRLLLLLLSLIVIVFTFISRFVASLIFCAVGSSNGTYSHSAYKHKPNSPTQPIQTSDTDDPLRIQTT